MTSLTTLLRPGRLARRLYAVAIAAVLAAPLPAAAMDYINVTLQPDSAVPTACFTFSSAPRHDQRQVTEAFVALAPALDHSVDLRGNDLCVGGFRYGETNTVTLKAGLPGVDGTSLPKSVTVVVRVPDRVPAVSFNAAKTLLPFTKGVGLPIKSVNVAKAHVVLYHLNDRTMVDHLADDWFGHDLDGIYQVEDNATKVYEGSLDIAAVRNKQVATTMPLDALVKGLQPGVYVAVASPTVAGKDAGPSATQWFSVSDLGLTTIKTQAGMLVVARSLQSALPQPGVTVKLFSRANEVLGTYRTGPEGRLTIPSGLLRGAHGEAPKVVAAYSEGGGFAWLQVDAPALDLADLDLKGRTPPDGNDAFLWTDRGVYRPGETVHLGALLRERDAKPVAGVPMTIHVVRPDDIEVETRPIDLAAASGGTLDYPIAENAVSGTWRFWASAGDKREIGQVEVSVQDFVPPRLEAKVESAATALGADGTITASVSADYFYGSPGADLTGTLEGTLQAAEHPFQGLDAFAFGLSNEPFLPRALKAEDFTTDDKGKADVALKAESVPDTSHPLEIALRATVNDVDGRPAEAQTTRVLRTAARFIGIRRGFTQLPDGATAGFDLALVDGAGAPIGGENLKWSLVKEDYTYGYFYRDGRWQSQASVVDQRVEGGDVALDAQGRAKLSARVTNGRWRMEVYDRSGATASSVRFEAGWWASDLSEDRKPEIMPVSVDAHPPAGKIRAMVETSFAGRVLVMLDGNGLHGVREIDMPKGGGPVEFDAADVPASGGYVLAIAVSPAGAVIPRLPVRAVGLAWVPGQAASHRLDVSIAAPAKIEPKTGLDVDITAKGVAPGEDAYVTLAAVDEAVLRMTAFATPDPADFYLGRRQPGFELRDLYNSLIDPEGAPGRLVEGGDGKNANLDLGGLDVKTFKTVALFKGPVKLDADGHARITLAVPDFSGRLRLMAVAWSGERFGKADRPVAVRPPMLAELTLPRFLAPGDTTRARILLTDLDAPEGTYKVAVSTTGAVSIDRTDALFKTVTRDRRRYVDRTLTAGATAGVGRIHMVVTGEDGSTTERDFEIPVRAPNAYVTQRQVVALPAGGGLAIDDALASGMVPGTTRIDLTAATVPSIDVAGLLASLRRYPYGCAEQTISRAFPELFVGRLGGTLAVPVPDAVTGQGAIQRLVALQASDGSFGYWSSVDTGNVWLTAYAIDFMQHARAAGLSVPEGMESKATSWLTGRFAATELKPDDVAAASYAAIVLSRANSLDLAQLRYFATRVRGSLPSDIARVQLASALERVGERDMAATIAAAPPVARNPKVWLNDYGSPLRDQAMVLALLSEEKLVSRKILFERALDLARATGGKTYLSTQEEAWLLRAAFDLHGTTPLAVRIDGKPNKPGADSVHASFPGKAASAHKLVNDGRETIYASVATTGIPDGPQPAEANGFTVSRTFYKLDGTPADLADVHQNDELVIVLDGAMAEKIRRKILAVDLLPAGLEPETVGLATDRDDGQFKWLKGLTEPTFFALRDDRYLAGMDLDEAKPKFRFAYVVRAVSPGLFASPGSQVEDMYAPAFHARGAAGALEVKPARKPAPALAEPKP